MPQSATLLNTSSRVTARPSTSYVTSPFGSSLPNRAWSDVSRGYRYGFNYQEKDSELGEYYAFEYRIHDARLGRFMSVDPLCKKYPWNSNYSFYENKVIRFIELEGLESAESILWNDIGIDQNVANQVVDNVNNGINKAAEAVDKYIVPGVAIVGGAVAIAATAVSVGVVAPPLIASLTILSGTMAIVSGGVKFGLNVSGQTDAASIIPTSYSGATVSTVIKVTNGYNVSTKVISGALEFLEGSISLKFKEASDLDKAGNVISIVSMTITGTSIDTDISNANTAPTSITGGMPSSVSSGAILANRLSDSKISKKSNTDNKFVNKKSDVYSVNFDSSISRSTLKCDQDVLKKPKEPVMLKKKK